MARTNCHKAVSINFIQILEQVCQMQQSRSRLIIQRKILKKKNTYIYIYIYIYIHIYIYIVYMNKTNKLALDRADSFLKKKKEKGKS